MFPEILIYIVFGIALASSIIVSFWILRQRKISIWLAIPLAITFLPIGYVDRYLVDLPGLLSRSPFFIVVAVSVLILVDRPSVFGQVPKMFLLIYSLLFLESIISCLVNETPFVDIFYTHRGFLVLFAFVIIFNRFQHVLKTDSLLRFIVWMAVLNGCIAVFERVVMVSILRMGSGDMVSGVFSSDGQFLFFQLVGIIVVVAYWFHGQNVIRFPNGQVITLLLISIAIGNNKASWGFIAAVFLVMGYQVGLKLFFKNFGKVIWLGILGAFSYSVFDAVYVSFYNKTHESEIGIAGYVANPEFIQYYLFGSDEADTQFSKSGALKRGAAVSFGWNHIKEEGLTTIFGLGAGSTTDKAFSGENGFFNFRYPNYKVSRTSLSLILAEFGLAGIGCLILFAFVIYASTKSSETNKMLLIKKTVAILIIGYFGYESLIEETSHMFIMAVMFTLAVPEKKIVDGNQA